MINGAIKIVGTSDAILEQDPKARVAVETMVTTGLVHVAGEVSTEAYVDMTTSAMMGDREGFLDGFTGDSRALVESIIGLSEAYGLQEANPYELLVFDSVDGEEIAENGETAVLTVRTRSRSRKILMVKDDGEWRIDTKKLETFWDEERKRR